MENIIMQLDKMNMSDALKLGVACIYAVRCDVTRMVYVSYTTNLLVAIGRLVERMGTAELSRMKYDAENHEVVIDVLCTDIDILQNKKMTKLYTSNYANEYKDRGYSLYKPTNLVQYKLEKSIQIVNRLVALYMVNIVNSRNDKILVGAFRTKREMEEFCSLYYPNDSIKGFYCANNEDTQKLLPIYHRETLEGTNEVSTLEMLSRRK
jgi:hypothetical protein